MPIIISLYAVFKINWDKCFPINMNYEYIEVQFKEKYICSQVVVKQQNKRLYQNFKIWARSGLAKDSDNFDNYDNTP